MTKIQCRRSDEEYSDEWKDWKTSLEGKTEAHYFLLNQKGCEFDNGIYYEANWEYRIV